LEKYLNDKDFVSNVIGELEISVGVESKKRDVTVGAQFPIVANSGLNVTILGGNVNKSNCSCAVDSKSLALTANSSNYVYIDWATNIISFNTTGFPSCCIALWEIVTDASSVTAKIDNRSVLRASMHSKIMTKSSWLLNQAFTSDSGWITLDLSGDAPCGATGVKLEVRVQESGTPGNSVKFSCRKDSSESGASESQCIWPQISGATHSRLMGIGLDDNQCIEYRAEPDTSLSVSVGLSGWEFGG